MHFDCDTRGPALVDARVLSGYRLNTAATVETFIGSSA